MNSSHGIFRTHFFKVNTFNRSICKLDLRSTVGSTIENIKETFLPKTGMWKKQVLQDPGGSLTLSKHVACNVAKSYKSS